MDGLEDQIPLVRPKRNFRNIIKKHKARLLHTSRTIGKKYAPSDGSNLEMKILSFFMTWQENNTQGILFLNFSLLMAVLSLITMIKLLSSGKLIRV